MFQKAMSSKMMVQHSQGMTLIELMFTLSVLIALAYASFLSFRPTHEFSRAQLVLAQHAQIVMGLHAYYSLYGDWPDRAGNCAQALEVMNTPTRLIARQTTNAFGSEYQIHCGASGQNQQPIVVTQSIPVQFAAYFQRYMPRAEFPEVLPTEPGANVVVDSVIPPPIGSKTVYFAQGRFGEGQFNPAAFGGEEPQLLQQLQAQDLELTLSAIDIQGLGPFEAFIPRPNACRGSENADILMSSTSICPAAEVQLVAQASYPLSGELRVLSLSGQERRYLHTGTIDVTRTFYIRHIHSDDIEACDVRQTGELACDEDAQDGWRYRLRWEAGYRYDVQYSLSSGSDDPTVFLRTFTSEALSESQLRRRIFDWDGLDAFLQPIVSFGISISSREIFTLDRQLPEDLSLLEFEGLSLDMGSCSGEYVPEVVTDRYFDPGALGLGTLVFQPVFPFPRLAHAIIQCSESN